MCFSVAVCQLYQEGGNHAYNCLTQATVAWSPTPAARQYDVAIAGSHIRRGAHAMTNAKYFHGEGTLHGICS
jgi:hypothetical protein